MKKIIFFFALLLFAATTKAQTDFIERFPNTSVLTAEETILYGKLSNVGRFSSAKLIKVKNLATNVNASGNLQILLTEDEYQQEECQSLEFAAQASRYIDDQNYYYYGILIEGDSCDCKCQSGEIMLEAREGRKYGYVVADDVRFEILALNSEYSIMARVNPSFFDEGAECLKLPESQSPTYPHEQAAASRSGETCVIRVLFLYTQAAEDKYGLLGLLDMAALGLSQTNQAFTNSGVEDVCVGWSNHRKYVGFAEDPDDIGGDMQALLIDDVVAQWREDDLADVVCLITDADYDDLLGLAGYIPDPNNPGQIISNAGNPMPDFAYMIVEGSSFNSNFTFSHEMGHVLGCRHQTCALYDNDGCDDGGVTEHGHGWGHRRCWLCGWKNYSTIMHQLRNNNKRLLRYSNPEINDKGATGVVGISENAQWIRDGNGCTVSDYFPDPPSLPFSANIIGSDFICQPFSEIYSAGVTGANGSLTYEWHISTDGVNWDSPAGSNASIELFSTNFSVGATVFLRVKVTNQAGNSVYAFFNVLIKENSVICFRSEGNALNSSGQVFAAFPNPSDDLMQVTIGVLENNVPLLIRLFSLTGELLEERRYMHNPGTHTETISLKSHPTGVYVLRAQIGNMFFNKLIVKS